MKRMAAVVVALGAMVVMAEVPERWRPVPTEWSCRGDNCNTARRGIPKPGENEPVELVVYAPGPSLT
jgi:hypothetical protein